MTSKQHYNIRDFSLHRICSSTEFGFEPEEYSKFKHGADNIAQKYGYALADAFIDRCFSKYYDGNPVVIAPSAYSHIPAASFYMKNYFADKLNDYLYEHNYAVSEEIKIYRSVSYREDYGEMTAEQRYNLIKGDTFYIDKSFVANKTLLFLDDIKITGTHEKIIINMLRQNNLTNPVYMLYFAELANNSIAPAIENVLNNAFVKNLDHIHHIIQNERFRFNTRVVKYILNSSENDFDRFIDKQDKSFAESLYYNAIGNEYFKFPVYLRNLEKLKTIVS
jgi:hypothetical protein